MSFAENMESILSTYDDDDDIDFMSCDVCNVKIRSDSIYRIHLTTGRHLKREEALIAKGKAGRQPPLPEWTNYMDYLDYLQLDEPIVGLKHLVEVDPPSGSPGPWYLCRLCRLDTDMPGITNHIIGRKHRQKYLETHRPDLVTWGKTNSSQPGKVVRAKAEVAERQDGRGVPERSQKKHGPAINRGTLKDLSTQARGRQAPRGGHNPSRPAPLFPDIKQQRDSHSGRGYPQEGYPGLHYPDSFAPGEEWRAQQSQGRSLEEEGLHSNRNPYELPEESYSAYHPGDGIRPERDGRRGGAYEGQFRRGGANEEDRRGEVYSGEGRRGGAYEGGRLEAYGGEGKRGRAHGGEQKKAGAYEGDGRRGGAYEGRRGGAYEGDGRRGGAYDGDGGRGGAYGGDGGRGGAYEGDGERGGAYEGDVGTGGAYDRERGDGRRGGAYEGDWGGDAYEGDGGRGRDYEHGGREGGAYDRTGRRGRTYEERRGGGAFEGDERGGGAYEGDDRGSGTYGDSRGGRAYEGDGRGGGAYEGDGRGGGAYEGDGRGGGAYEGDGRGGGAYGGDGRGGGAYEGDGRGGGAYEGDGIGGRAYEGDGRGGGAYEGDGRGGGAYEGDGRGVGAYEGDGRGVGAYEGDGRGVGRGVGAYEGDGRGGGAYNQEQLQQQRGLPEREAPVALSGLPETFKRFLSGEKRRASRFTPATEPSREAGLDSKKRKLDASGLAEMVPLGSRGDLLDYLKNIDIESVEDANFIKAKLCNLLKEFQANKSERAKVREYHHLSSQQHEPSADSTGPFLDPQDHQRGSHVHFQRGQMNQDHYNRIPEDLPDRFERGRRDPQDYIERGAMSSQDHFELDHRNPQDDFERDPAGGQDYFERDLRHSPDRYGRGLEDRFDPVPRRSRERSKEGHVDPRAAAHDSYEGVWPPHRRADMMRPTQGFQPPSPPRQDSASLEKITSTLLQLVARRQRF